MTTRDIWEATTASFTRKRALSAPPLTCAALALALLLLAHTDAAAQTFSSNAGGRPAESKTGAAGVSTYARDKIESVNLVNGNFSMSVPLATVGGRGSAAFAVALSYNSKVWSAQHHVELVPLSWRDQNAGPDKIDHYSALFDDPVAHNPNTLYLGGGWSILKGPTMKSQVVYIDPVVPCPGDAGGDQTNLEDEGCYKYALTKMWLVLPDGSEVEMRDSLTDGAPYLLPTPRTKLDRDRGSVWHSTDGSGITLVSNASGSWVFFPDGSRYRTANGRTTLYDADGNYLTIDYDQPSAGDVTYADQLGRQTVLHPLFSTGGVSVTAKGYNGAPDRTVTIDTGVIGALNSSGVADNLRADYRSLPRPFTSGDDQRSVTGEILHTLTSPHTDLFVGSEGGQSVDDFSMVTRINLLDGRSLRFRYDPYGEVAEVVYPGGGVSRIDYGGFRTSMCEVLIPSVSEILDRRVVRRQTLTDGSTPDATWIYAGGSPSMNNSVEARSGDGGAGSQLLLSETHYYLAANAEYRVCVGAGESNGTTYERWDDAKEFRVERQTGAGTEVTVRHWEQRAPVVWGNDPGLPYNAYAAQHGQEQPANDPRVTWEETTLEDGKTKRVEYTYDQFNNVTLVKEYDFRAAGAQPPGTLLRQTVRTYVGDAPDPSYNGYCYTNLNPLDPSCGSGVASDAATIIHQKHLLLSEQVLDGTGNQEAYSEREFDNYTSGDGNHQALTFNAGMTQYDGARFSAFDSARQPRGNVTMTKGWVEGAGQGATYSVAYSRYDNAGNVVSLKDPRGFVSTVSYADDFGDGTNPGGSLTGAKGATYAFPAAATNALGHTSRTQYDYTLGAATGVKDANGVVTRTEYDRIGRPVRTTAALGLAEQSVAEMSYPTASENVARVSRQLDSARWLASRTEFDGFERPVLAATSEDGQHASLAAFSIFTKTFYDPLGRVKSVTNPYRTQPASTDGWARTSYDLAGRVTEVATFAGDASTPPPGAGTNASWTGSVVTTYAGEQTTVRDQANKQRRSTVDGLGRLVSVDEMLEYPSSSVYATTTYDYDARGNLKTVRQGEQTRSFAYDGLSRLKSATNPEVCQQQQSQCAAVPVTYAYDLSGNLTQKLDARGISVLYTYDALGRVLSRSYTGKPTNPTPDVTYSYDDPAVEKSRGRLTSVSSSVSTYLYTAFDAMGRVRGTSQTTGGVTYSMPDYRYDLAGNLTSQQYPSGKTVKTEYDSAGRVSGVKDQATGLYYAGAQATDEANRIGYTAGGAASTVRLGNGLWEHTSFNSRLQPTQIGLGTSITNSSTLRLDYTYGALTGNTLDATKNNGNVQSQTITVPGMAQPYVQTYAYDELNRLKSAVETNTLVSTTDPTWKQFYAYDRYGNRSLAEGTTWPAQFAQLDSTNNPSVSASNNRITSAGHTYDSAGNLLCDPAHPCAQSPQFTPFYTYDAENKMTTAGGPPTSGGSSYAYDGDGHRVKKVVGRVTTVFVYDAGGRMVAEYGNDQPQAVGTSYVTQDHLGSTRVVTGQDQGARGRYDYLPFGEEVYAGRSGYGGSDVRQKFTGYERDSETGLDFAQARYYVAAVGRFSSADPLLASGRAAKPQTWNRYSYAQNNPLRLIDPSGMSDGTAQQHELAQTPLSTPPPQQTPVVTISPEEARELLGGMFGTCADKCPDGAKFVPFSPDVNNKIVTSVAQMASNIENGMVATYNLEKTPVTSTQTSLTNATTLTLQAGTGPQGPSVSGSIGNQTTISFTVTAQTSGPIVTAVRNANDTLQIQLGQTLEPMQSPTINDPQGAILRQVPAPNADNLAVGTADFARTQANVVAVKFYHKHFPGRPLSEAFSNSLFGAILAPKRF